jgi:hypothetical protein
MNCTDGNSGGKYKLCMKKLEFIIICLQNRSGITVVVICILLFYVNILA